MSDKKISQLPASTTPLAGTETLAVVQSGDTKKVAVSDLTAGRAVDMATGSTIGSGFGAAGLSVNGGASSPVYVSFQGAGADQWLLGKGPATTSTNFELYNAAGAVALSVDKTTNVSTFGASVSVTGSASTTGNVTVGAAAAGTNRTLIINGVVNKAGRIAFQESGSDKWLVGNGAASENGNFEFYNAAGVQSLVINRTSHDVTIGGGNLVIGTAGKGIDFSATSQAAGMTSELLDDYEEGTWTPIFGGSGGESGQVFDIQTANYSKVGRMVYASFDVRLSTLGTITGSVQIKGLPFTSANQSGMGGYLSFWSGMTTSYVNLYLANTPNSTAVDVYGLTGASTSVGAALTQANLSATSRLYGTIVYQV
jgi:hypothetical protein